METPNVEMKKQDNQVKHCPKCNRERMGGKTCPYCDCDLVLGESEPQAANTVQGQDWLLRGVINLLAVSKCPNCDGSGSIPVPLGEHFVTHDMASDAGEPLMEGQSTGIEWGQEQCGWCEARRDLSEIVTKPADASSSPKDSSPLSLLLDQIEQRANEVDSEDLLREVTIKLQDSCIQIDPAKVYPVLREAFAKLASSRTDIPALVKALRRAVEMIIACSGDVIFLNQRRAELTAILTQAK